MRRRPHWPETFFFWANPGGFSERSENVQLGQNRYGSWENLLGGLVERPPRAINRDGWSRIEERMREDLCNSIFSGRNTLEASCLGWLDFEPRQADMPGVESTEEMARSLGIDEGLMHRIGVSLVRYLVGTKRRYYMPSVTLIGQWNDGLRIAANSRAGKAFQMQSWETRL